MKRIGHKHGELGRAMGRKVTVVVLDGLGAGNAPDAAAFGDEAANTLANTARGVIGDRPASGTEIIEELGAEQERTGAWILYTSADSVFQVAANTDHIPLEELYEACKKAHKMLIGEGRIMVERVIARPFHGEPGAYERENENRHDYGISPPQESYMDLIKEAGLSVVAGGKKRGNFHGGGGP